MNPKAIIGLVAIPLGVSLLLAAPTAVQAQFEYTTNADNTLTITNYTGSGGDVIIPTNINGLPVTDIGNETFFGDSGLTSVTIPDSVTNIGAGAFQGCTRLTSVAIPASVLNIDVSAFMLCASLTNVAIPNSITFIEGGTFYGCASLTNIIIPASVRNIGEDAFFGCTSLIGVFFQGNVPDYDSPIFQGNGHLVSYYLPNATGWGSGFAGLSAVLWNPLIQASGSSFGVNDNQFGFNITGTANIPIVVEACTNLANPVWTPLQTLNLTSGSFFTEPFQANSSGRFYRISSP